MAQSSMIIPATVTLGCVTASNLINGSTGKDLVKPVGATLIAFGVLSVASKPAPQLTNIFAWTITATAVVTLGLPLIERFNKR